MHSVLFCFPSSATFHVSLFPISSSNRCSRQTISKPNGIWKLSGMPTSDSKWDHYKKLECFVRKCYVEIDQHTSFFPVLSSAQLSGDRGYFCGKKNFIIHIDSLEHSWLEWHLFFILLDALSVSYETTKRHHQIRQNVWIHSIETDMCLWQVSVWEKTTFYQNCAHPQLLDRESRHLHRNWIIDWSLGRMTAMFSKVWEIFGIRETGWLLPNFRQPRVCTCISHETVVFLFSS